ncbi:MAG: UPF0261 family protein, partial [Hyphomicrobiales bacterium]|nr:UPF0261 family protein [Hyphomicrobiales bacterium]
MAQKVVAILGTLDSKGEEYGFLKNQIESHGVATLVIDAGVLGSPAFTPDIVATDVASAAGADRAALAAAKDRGKAVAAMGQGAASLVSKLHEAGRIDGIISMGGGGGTS